MDNSSLNAKLFYQEVEKNLKKLANKHGFDIPKFNGYAQDGVMFLNVTAFEGDSNDYYRSWYLKHSEELGMDSSWIGIQFNSPDKEESLELVGLDPDGGSECIRVKNQSGKFFHMTPASVSFLITSS